MLIILDSIFGNIVFFLTYDETELRIKWKENKYLKKTKSYQNLIIKSITW